MLAHAELGTCKASLVSPEQFVPSICVSPTDMAVLTVTYHIMKLDLGELPWLHQRKAS